MGIPHLIPPRLFLAAPHKSSGKTTLTLGLARALADRGRIVQPFKRGPDYIDPLWLGMAARRTCYNLDFNTQTPEEIVTLAARAANGADMALIEGNMGLFDGITPDGGPPQTNATLARLLKAPIVLVVDAAGMGRGVAALVQGYQNFEADLPFAGVILNKVAGRGHEASLRAAVRDYTSVPVLGAVPRSDSRGIGERHLGLVPANEHQGAEEIIARLAAFIADHVDLERLTAAAAPPLSVTVTAHAPSPRRRPLRIAVARDSAFGFTYADDLDALAAEGAEVVFTSPLHDARLPEGIDGLFLPGGFPETHAAGLAANAAYRAQLLTALKAGLPCYAECGGLMYLCQSLRWGEARHAMVGLIEAETVMHPRPQGRGLTRLRPTGLAPWLPETRADGLIPAHEFHHSALSPRPALAAVYHVERGTGLGGGVDGVVVGNTVAAYAHLRRVWVRPFLNFCAALNR